MPKKCIQFISGFLVPSLNDKRFGDSLMWLDKEKKIFQIDWCHKGGLRWTEKEAQVFVEWDKHKGHYQPEDKEYFTKSKQRFRALLYKLTCDRQIMQLQSQNKYMKIFSIGEKKKRKKRSSISSASESSECTLYEEDCEDMFDIAHLDGECERKVSDDNTRNILEDHSYTPHVYLQSDLISAQEVLNGLSEKVLGSYPCKELNDRLLSLQESTNSSLKKVLVKLNNPDVPNHSLHSAQESTNSQFMKCSFPYNALNNNLSTLLSNDADDDLVPENTTYEVTQSSLNAILKVPDDENGTFINLWKYSKENEAPDDPMISQNVQETWSIFESTSLPLSVLSTDLDSDDFLSS